ncbi:PREDICTED: ubiquitin-like protein 4A isoform X1 [Acropora digitifera]|uniref:ubiquitin-like protein 4A isoform X1 n=1 Tax=Acropora digitifera TaxID=70779 RepID=UPI00077A7B44|nr:PREDICTED: ubiquitin-like protein 4A isoform X1 [Acropora digitifera]
MYILVKKLNGQEVRLEVSDNDEIALLKREISTKLRIPVAQQRLVFKGKTLADASRLRDHRIVDGSKLHLSVKQETTVENIEDPNEFNTQLRIFLKRHLNTQDTEKVMAKFKEQFKTWISSLSLDDIERLATIHMKEASSY